MPVQISQCNRSYSNKARERRFVKSRGNGYAVRLEKPGNPPYARKSAIKEDGHHYCGRELTTSEQASQEEEDGRFAMRMIASEATEPL